MSRPRLALLDRDGTINVKAPEGSYVTRVEDLILLPGAADAIGRLTKVGIEVSVVTNQRCVSLGLLSTAELDRIHDRLRSLIAMAGGEIRDIYYCPHAKEAHCRCRKPEPGMLLDAMHSAGAQQQSVVMVGDAPSDIQAGRRAGIKTAQITDDPGSSVADLTGSSLTEIVADLISK